MAADIITRRGERVWFRSTSRSSNASTGDSIWVYDNNQSALMRITQYYNDEHGRNILLPTGKAIGWGRPGDFWNDSMKLKQNDEIIRLPDNYSSGTSDIFRVDNVVRVTTVNTSVYYVRVDLSLTKARD